MFAVIYIEDFFLQAVLRQEPEAFSRAVVLLDAEGKTVLQMTPSARASGLREGLTSIQALARCAEVIFKTRSAGQEKLATDVLLQCAHTFSPRIESTAPGLCTLDLKGLAAVSAEWGRRLVDQLGRLNLRARVGMAGHPGVALHAARRGPAVLMVEEESADFISSLPVSCLEPGPGTREILRRWGIGTVGEFLALGQDRLTERLGGEAMEMWERAVPGRPRPLTLVQPVEVFEESMEFEQGVETLEPLLFILRRFIEQLSMRLEGFGWVAQEIQLRLNLSSGAIYERAFRVPSPTRSTDTLFRMLHTHLENVQTDAPIMALRLVLQPGKSEHFQFGLFETALRDPNHFYETLAQLTSMAGGDRVGVPVRADTHRPDVFRLEPANFEAIRSEPAGTSNGGAVSGPALRRFRPPAAAIVETRHGRPVLLHSEPYVGGIVRSAGPYGQSGDWWQRDRVWRREEWDVETARGGLLRIFEEDGEWFVEGVFD